MDNTVYLKRDFYFGIATLVFSVLMFFSIKFYISDSAFTGISGRAFPYVINVFLLLLGTALCWDCRSRLSACNESGECFDTCALTKKQICDICVWFGMVCLYVIGISFIGFLVSTYLVLAVMLWFLGLRKSVPFIAMLSILPPLLYWLFHKIVEVQFPEALFI